MKTTVIITLSLLIASTAATCTAANISSPGAHIRRMQNPAYANYVGRLRDRRYIALSIRRDINMSKPPARGRTAVVIPFNPAMPFGNFIERGRVWQPPIYRPRHRLPVIVISRDHDSPGYND